MTLSDWVLVPRVATEEMWSNGMDSSPHANYDANDVYSRMLAAAPQPPVEEMVEIVAQEMFTRINAGMSSKWDTVDVYYRDTYRDHARAIVAQLIKGE